MGKFYLEKIQQKQKSKNVKNERESLTDYIEYFYLEMQLRKSTQKSDFRVSIWSNTGWKLEDGNSFPVLQTSVHNIDNLSLCSRK